MAYPWSKVVFTHQGGAGNLLGPGRQDAFDLTTNKQARIEGEITENGRGTYQATDSYPGGDLDPDVALTQNGQARGPIPYSGHALE